MQTIEAIFKTLEDVFGRVYAVGAREKVFNP